MPFSFYQLFSINWLNTIIIYVRRTKASLSLHQILLAYIVRFGEYIFFSVTIFYAKSNVLKCTKLPTVHYCSGFFHKHIVKISRFHSNPVFCQKRYLMKQFVRVFVDYMKVIMEISRVEREKKQTWFGQDLGCLDS